MVYAVNKMLMHVFTSCIILKNRNYIHVWSRTSSKQLFLVWALKQNILNIYFISIRQEENARSESLPYTLTSPTSQFTWTWQVSVPYQGLVFCHLVNSFEKMSYTTS